MQSSPYPSWSVSYISLKILASRTDDMVWPWLTEMNKIARWENWNLLRTDCKSFLHAQVHKISSKQHYQHFSVAFSTVPWSTNFTLHIHVGSCYSLRRVCQNVDSAVLIQAAACLCSCMAGEHGTRDVSLQSAIMLAFRRGSIGSYQFHLDLRPRMAVLVYRFG